MIKRIITFKYTPIVDHGCNFTRIVAVIFALYVA